MKSKSVMHETTPNSSANDSEAPALPGAASRDVRSGSASWIFSAGIGPRVMLSPDGGDGGGDAGGSEEGGQQGAGSESPADPGTPQRPDGIPDAFWDEKEGVKFGELGAHLATLESVKAEIDGKAAAVPESPDKYEAKLPDDFELPEGVEFKVDPDDPLLGVARNAAHQLGVDQAGFEKMVGAYAEMKLGETKEIEAAIGRQMEALGPKATERVEAAKNFITAAAGPDAVEIFDGILQLKGGVEAVEKIMRRAANGGVPGFNGSGREGGEGISDEDWAKMSPTQRMLTGIKADRQRRSA